MTTVAASVTPVGEPGRVERRRQLGGRDCAFCFIAVNAADEQHLVRTAQEPQPGPPHHHDLAAE
jgi:hypothetical protein